VPNAESRNSSGPAHPNARLTEVNRAGRQPGGGAALTRQAACFSL